MSYWTPPPHSFGGDDPVLFVIGDVAVTSTSVILPHGRYPLAGSRWTVQNQTFVTQATPSWALIVALVGFFFICVFSLFFLLAKESRVSGTFLITVQGQHGLHHTTQVPALNAMTAPWVYQQVNQAQMLANR